MRTSIGLIVFAMSASAFAQSPPVLVITPPKLNFAAQTVNSQSAPTTITVANQSGAALRVHQILASGIDFSATNTCGNEIADGVQCTVQVTFKPAISGERLGSLQIVTSDAESPHVVPLSGTGTDQ